MSTNSQDSNVTAYSMQQRRAQFHRHLRHRPAAGGHRNRSFDEHFLYTVNFLDNTVSGFELSTTNGTLLDSQNSPFPSNDQPTAAAAIPHNGTGGGIQP